MKVEQRLGPEVHVEGKLVNKSQLIDALAARYEGNRKAAQQALESVLDTITREVAKGEKVAITGFGSFEKRVRDARWVRNPQTGARIKAKKTAVPKFTAGQDLKNVVSGAKKLSEARGREGHGSGKEGGPARAAAPAKKTATKSTGTAKKTAAKTSSAAKKTRQQVDEHGQEDRQEVDEHGQEDREEGAGQEDRRQDDGRGQEDRQQDDGHGEEDRQEGTGQEDRQEVLIQKDSSAPPRDGGSSARTAHRQSLERDRGNRGCRVGTQAQAHGGPEVADVVDVVAQAGQLALDRPGTGFRMQSRRSEPELRRELFQRRGVERRTVARRVRHEPRPARLLGESDLELVGGQARQVGADGDRHQVRPAAGGLHGGQDSDWR